MQEQEGLLADALAMVKETHDVFLFLIGELRLLWLVTVRHDLTHNEQVHLVISGRTLPSRSCMGSSRGTRSSLFTKCRYREISRKCHRGILSAIGA